MVLRYFLITIFIFSKTCWSIELDGQGVFSSEIDKIILQEADEIDNVTERVEVIPFLKMTKVGEGQYVGKKCFKTLSDRGIPRASALELFEDAMTLAKERIQMCEESYPELSEYLEEFKKRFNPHLFHCGGNADSDWAGHSGAFRFHSFLNVSEHKYFSEPTQRRRNSFIDTIIHEVFHATSGADNRPDHNSIETVNYDPANPCAEDMYADRIVNLTALCNRYNGNEADQNGETTELDQYEPLTSVLFKKMSKCGSSAGCVKLLSKENDERISLEQTQSLCLKIYNEGACYNLRRDLSIVGEITPGAKQVINDFIDDVEEQFEFYGNWKNYDEKALSLFPKTKSKIDSLLNEECISSRTGLNNDLFPTTLVDLDRRPTRRGLGSYVQGLTYKIKTLAISTQNTWDDQTNSYITADCSDSVKEKASILFDEFGDEASESNFANPFKSYFVFDNFNYFDYSSIGELSNFLVSSGLITKERFTSFTEELEKYHPGSNSFDCELNGFNPLINFEDIMSINNIDPNTNCSSSTNGDQIQ